jgi:tRNA (guanine26-N2/guanine27-N2)-dimethyltransferase
MMDFPTETIREGIGTFLVPKLKAFVKSPEEYAPSKAPVFFNPVMEFNRDIAVLALQAFQKTVNREIVVCEPLASCGIRGVRFAREVQGIKKVVMNDINRRATIIAEQNIKINRIGKKVVARNRDANWLLSSYSAPHKRFDVIDVDPFGSPVHYMDSALRALRNQGLLALTATDMAPLCGVHPKACIRKYGGKPLRTEYCHELAARLLLGCLAVMAAKHEIGVEPVFSHVSDHYARVYATIAYGARKADESLDNMGYVLHCFNCFHRESIKGLIPNGLSMKCIECGSPLKVGGPLWVGDLSQGGFCELMLDETRKRSLRNGAKIEKMLNLAKAEAEAPLGYYVIDKLCDKLNSPVPSIKKVVEAIGKKGYGTWLTHFSPKGIKSAAPASVMMEVLRQMLPSESDRGQF